MQRSKQWLQYMLSISIPFSRKKFVPSLSAGSYLRSPQYGRECGQDKFVASSMRFVFIFSRFRQHTCSLPAAAWWGHQTPRRSSSETAQFSFLPRNVNRCERRVTFLPARNLHQRSLDARCKAFRSRAAVDVGHCFAQRKHFFVNDATRSGGCGSDGYSLNVRDLENKWGKEGHDLVSPTC